MHGLLLHRYYHVAVAGLSKVYQTDVVLIIMNLPGLHILQPGQVRQQ